MHDPSDPEAARHLAADMAAAGFAPPVLVVADHVSITRSALRWAESFAERGWPHRVLAFGGGPGHRDVEAIEAEARSLAAATIVGAGHGALIDAVRRAAASTGLRSVTAPATRSGHEAIDQGGG
jgi:glycerol dehydrogenase-like iron-containing ADH family enzyme